MRVLHLTTTGWNPYEGVARAVDALARRIPAEHHLCATRAAGDCFAATHDLRGGVAPKPWSTRLRAVLRSVQPDVVHVHGGEGAGALAACIPLGAAPVVVSVYGRLSPPEVHRPNSWSDHRRANMPLHRRLVTHRTGIPLLRAALQQGRIAAVCSPDPSIVERLAPFGAVHLSRGAADPSPRRARWSDRPRIVFAGRAETGRGIDDLLLAYLKVRRVRADAALTLALLPSPQADRWRDLLLPGVDVRVGASASLDATLAGSQVAALPFRMDATISPAFVAAEAMAVGLPVVASNVACLRCLVRDGHNGRLIAPNDADGLAAALLDVLAAESHWTELSNGARRTIETDWGWDGAADVVLRAYRDALGRPSRRVA